MKRPYFFEIFALANLGIVAAFAWPTLPLVGSLPRQILLFCQALAIDMLAGLAVRAVIALVRRDRAYFRRIVTVSWIVDSLRMIVAGSIAIVTYGWIKLVVPIYHPRLFDRELWELDRVLFFGLSPNIFFLDLFSGEWFLRFIDWTYANIFLASTFIGFAFVLSEPSRRLRVAFVNGNAMLWISGAWLYLLLPSLGPAYRFPDLWFVHDQLLERTQALQALLMRNYQNVLRAATGRPSGPVVIAFGIAAFPSLHVGFQTFVFFWMRKLWRPGELLFAIFAVTIFIGSMITGWHYLIDSLAGVILAFACYAVFWRRARMDRFLALRRLIRSR